MIPLLVYSRIHAHDLLITWTVFIVVIDDPAGLQVGVNRDRSDVLEASFLQILAYLL